MSVMVICDSPEDVEKILQPFCMSSAEVSNVDITDEVYDDYVHHDNENSIFDYNLMNGPSWDEYASMFGNAYDRSTGRIVVERLSDYKISWYILGGRFDKKFLTNEWQCVHSLYRDQLNFTCISLNHNMQIARLWSNVRAAFSEEEIKKIAATKTWSEVYDSWPLATIDEDECENAYNHWCNQEMISDICEVLNSVLATNSFGNGHIEEAIIACRVNINEFIMQYKNKAIGCLAYILDGKWHAIGDMGMFGSYTKKKKQDEWEKEVFELIRDLPADKFISIVDCHR